MLCPINKYSQSHFNMISKFITDIEESFSSVDYPGDQNIASEDGMEGSEVNDALRGKLWKDLQYRNVSELSFALIYFKPKAFVYFLPYFIIGSIKDDEAAYGSSCFSILQSFIPPEAKDTDFDARMKLLSKEQLELIQRYLYYLLAIGEQTETEIQKAMDYITKKLEEA